MSVVKSLLKAFNQKPIVVYPVYITLTGDHACAAALAQILYWRDIAGGEFYKTDDELSKEIYATPKQMKRIKAVLHRLSFLNISLKNVPARTFYDVDYEELGRVINEVSHSSSLYQKGQTSQSQMAQTSQSQMAQTSQSQMAQTSQSQMVPSITENTTEITPEITPEKDSYLYAAEGGLGLTEIQQNCFEWARSDDFWAKRIYNVKTFLRQWNKPDSAMKGQYENYLEMERKNATTSRTNTAGHGKSSCLDRVIEACE